MDDTEDIYLAIDTTQFEHEIELLDRVDQLLVNDARDGAYRLITEYLNLFHPGWETGAIREVDHDSGPEWRCRDDFSAQREWGRRARHTTRVFSALMWAEHFLATPMDSAAGRSQNAPLLMVRQALRLLRHANPEALPVGTRLGLPGQKEEWKIVEVTMKDGVALREMNYWPYTAIYRLFSTKGRRRTAYSCDIGLAQAYQVLSVPDTPREGLQERWGK